MALIFRSLFALILLALPVTAETIAGKARVIDGDTLVIGGEHIRLFGIDAPEHDQTCDRAGRVWPCGQDAAAALAEVVGRARISCEVQDRDRYGRAVSICQAGDSDIGAVMVEQGSAMAYRRYSLRYVAAETQAKAERKGIWGGQMVTPEEFRQGTEVEAPVPGCRIKGNVGTHGRIYHMPGQADYARTRINEAKGEAWFCTEAEARSAGFRKAKH